MSLIIGGVSIGGALAAGAATAVGSYAVGQMVGGGSSGGGGGGGGMMSAASAADPFSGERGRYMPALFDFMSNPANNNADPYGAAGIAGEMAGRQFTANIPGQTTGGQLMQQMLTPGYNFASSDPSYKWRLDQGNAALSSSMAAKGLLNSGAAAIEALNYGQGAASQEYGAQFARAGAQDTSQQRLQQNQFADQMAVNQFDVNRGQQYFQNLMGLNANQATTTNNMYSRLAQLSGAGTGNQAAAAQAIQQQNSAAAAGAQQIIDPITGAIKNIFAGNGAAGTGSQYISAGNQATFDTFINGLA